MGVREKRVLAGSEWELEGVKEKMALGGGDRTRGRRGGKEHKGEGRQAELGE